MRVWFMVGALVLGIIGAWGELGRGAQGRQPVESDGSAPVTAQDGSGTIPTPRAPLMGDIKP